MTDHISINAQRLSEVLDDMRRSGTLTALTTEIIAKYMGGFHSNKGVPVVDSWNAQFGKYLKSNSQKLGISEMQPKVKTIVEGNPTSASKWSISNYG